MIEIYTTAICPFCIRAKALLDQLGVEYKEQRVDVEPALRQEMIARSGRRTVPQIWVNSQHVGGCDDLYALHRRNLLEPMLGAVSA